MKYSEPSRGEFPCYLTKKYLTGRWTCRDGATENFSIWPGDAGVLLGPIQPAFHAGNAIYAIR